MLSSLKMTFDIWLFAQIGSALAFGFGVANGFKYVGEITNEDLNRRISRLIRVKHFETGIISDQAANWPNTFSAMFDSVFGAKHLSLACLMKSSVASMLLFSVCTLLLYFDTYGTLPYLSPKMFIIAASGGLFADYLSLLKTRRLLGVFSAQQTFSSLLAFLLMDVVVSLSIATLFVGLAASAQRTLVFLSVSGLSHRDSVWWSLVFPTFIDHIIEMFATWRGLVSIRAVYYDPIADEIYIGTTIPAYISALVTSIWLWLYAGSVFALRTVKMFDDLFQWLFAAVDIEKRPLQVIGAIAGLMAALMWLGFLSGHLKSGQRRSPQNRPMES